MFRSIILFVVILITIIAVIAILVDNGDRNWIPDQKEEDNAKWE
jgi:hypothetical protein